MTYWAKSRKEVCSERNVGTIVLKLYFAFYTAVWLTVDDNWQSQEDLVGRSALVCCPT